MNRHIIDSAKINLLMIPDIHERRLFRQQLELSITNNDNKQFQNILSEIVRSVRHTDTPKYTQNTIKYNEIPTFNHHLVYYLNLLVILGM